MMTSSIDLINLKMAFGSFDPESNTDAEAMHLLQECVRLNYSPPDFLLPYVGKAVEAWGKTKGNKIPFKDTQGEWDILIWHVHFYFVTANSDEEVQVKMQDAIKRTIKQFPTVAGKKVTYDTLERYYDRADSGYIKADVEEKHGSRIK